MLLSEVICLHSIVLQSDVFILLHNMQLLTKKVTFSLVILICFDLELVDVPKDIQHLTYQCAL